jgi:hypothetical protein
MKHPVSPAVYLSAVFLTACGCDAVGYPAVEVTLEDRVTRQPVPLGGAVVSSEGGRQAPRQETYPAAVSSATFTVCCTPGEWAVHVAKPGYAPFDTSVGVRSSGRCERPVLVRLVARLQPLPPAPTTRTIVPAV